MVIKKDKNCAELFAFHRNIKILSFLFNRTRNATTISTFLWQSSFFYGCLSVFLSSGPSFGRIAYPTSIFFTLLSFCLILAAFNFFYIIISKNVVLCPHAFPLNEIVNVFKNGMTPSQFKMSWRQVCMLKTKLVQSDSYRKGVYKRGQCSYQQWQWEIV